MSTWKLPETLQKQWRKDGGGKAKGWVTSRVPYIYAP